MNTLVFDIETVPDVELGRRLYDLGDLDDAGVAQAMFAKQRQVRQNDFLPPPQQRVVAISVLLRSRDGRVWLRVFADNARAIRAYEKVGFQHEGRLRQDNFSNGAFRDTLLMGLLRSEWAAAVPPLLPAP